jgi:hypothetical protein
MHHLVMGLSLPVFLGLLQGLLIDKQQREFDTPKLSDFLSAEAMMKIIHDSNPPSVGPHPSRYR